MEAALPLSAAARPAEQSRRPAVSATSSASLPLRFVIAGLLALCLGTAWLITRPELLTLYHYNPSIVALTHLFVLGWLCTVVMGATYQLVPVALETTLYSERMAKWQFAFHIVGFAGMVWMFRKWDMKQVGHFGCVMAVSAGLFVFNIARTLRRAPKWNVVGAAIASALAWLTLTIVAGLSLAAAKCSYGSTEGLATAEGIRSVVAGLRIVGTFMSRFDPISAMHAHAHLGVVGIFTMLIVGVSYKLIPMFTLSELQNPRRAFLSIALLNLGLMGSIAGILARSPWKFAFALLTITALGLHGVEIRAILRARRRAALDWGVKTFLAGVILLAPLSALAAVLAWPGLPLNAFTLRLENLYGFLGLIGFVSFAVIGMLNKIIPFLVWFHTYSPHVGLRQVPALADMYSERLQRASFRVWHIGLAVITAAILLASGPAVRAGAVLLGVSLALFAVNVGKILSHAVHPAVKPLTTPSKE